MWKSVDHGHSWTRISPDLTRATWAVPANAGKYASTVKPGPMGSITALSPSPRSLAILWAGTDDGNIQVTRDGGVTWTNVTPPSIKPWTRIFNIEAGHFDPLVAYAAANTLRLDEIAPHFYRTHDGGKTWTEINTGIAGDAVANTIREDPRQPGLLYAGTDTQVWVSFDDGDHWQSLRHNMPAISVRDLQIKDDAKCRCADLIAGTHGRGFWILDNVTPLRQAAAAKAALAKNEPYLFKPGPAVRVRFGVNEPTPWPPELPAGESAPPGALIDYYLAKDASGPVQLEILDASGKVVRTYSSTEPVFDPDPGKDMAAYDEVCKKTPTAAYCGLPLYWPAPQFIVSPKAGMHRFSWDLKFDPVSPVDLVPAGDEEATGAVPGRTYPNYNVPWVPPGTYTVRLTVDGATKTQPIVVRLDPRVQIAPAALAEAEHAQHRAVLGGGGRAPRLQRGARAGRDARRPIRRRSGCDQGRAGSARPDRTPAQHAAAPPSRRRAGDAVAGSGEQRAAGGGDGDAGGRGRADGGANRGGRRGARAGASRSWRDGRR